MGENWAGIAQEIDVALQSVGFECVLRKDGIAAGPEYDPTFGPSTDYTVVAIDDVVKFRDLNGTVIDQKKRILTVSAVQVTPNQNDQIQVRGVWHSVIEVMPLAPGGVDLLYELEIST